MAGYPAFDKYGKPTPEYLETAAKVIEKQFLKKENPLLVNYPLLTDKSVIATKPLKFYTYIPPNFTTEQAVQYAVKLWGKYAMLEVVLAGAANAPAKEYHVGYKLPMLIGPAVLETTDQKHTYCWYGESWADAFQNADKLQSPIFHAFEQFQEAFGYWCVRCADPNVSDPVDQHCLLCKRGWYDRPLKANLQPLYLAQSLGSGSGVSGPKKPLKWALQQSDGSLTWTPYDTNGATATDGTPYQVP